MAVTELGPILDIDPTNFTGPYESVNLGLAANLGNAYNANAPVGLTGDHTTLAAAYTSVPVNTSPPNQVKPVRGFRLAPGVKTAVYYCFRVPGGALGGALTNGINFELLLAMDPNQFDADITGTLAYFDVCGVKINAAAQTFGATTITPDDLVLGTVACVASQTAALPTAVGRFHVHQISSTNASLNTPAVGEWIMVRIRRLGDHQLDTNRGFLNVVAVSAYAY